MRRYRRLILIVMHIVVVVIVIVDHILVDRMQPPISGGAIVVEPVSGPRFGTAQIVRAGFTGPREGIVVGPIRGAQAGNQIVPIR